MAGLRKSFGVALVALVAAGGASIGLPVPVAAAAGPAGTIDPWLGERLDVAAPAERLRVIVNGSSVEASRAAVAAAGLEAVDELPLIGVTVAVGTPSAIRDVAGRQGVTLVEGDRPLDFFLDTSHEATRATLVDANPDVYPGADGTGVSIAIIDGGVQGRHPMFQGPDGSKVVRNLEVACAAPANCRDPGVTALTIRDDLDGDNDTDTSGHGTHVAGIAAGYAVTDSTGRTLVGAAPGAKLVGLSVAKAASTYYGALGAQYWVMVNHRTPCGTVKAECPPIRVVNNSYGPKGGGTFNASSATVTIQRKLVAEGVAMVWAAGNDGDQGTSVSGTDANRTNPPGNDPTPGVLMVASYDDADSGDRDNALSSFSSRGQAAVKDSYPDISAPGDTIYASCPIPLADCATGLSSDIEYANLSGTSMAAPHVAGYLARIFSADPALQPGEAEDLIEDTAHRFTAGAPYVSDPNNTDHETSLDKGHGLIDVAAALAELKGVEVPAGGPDPCATATSADDPTGDATILKLGELGTPPLPLDDSDLTRIGVSDKDGALRVRATVVDMPDQPRSKGDAVLGFFAIAGSQFRMFANRDVNPAGPPPVTASVSKQTGVDATGLPTYGPSTPVSARFDPSDSGPTANSVMVDIPASVLGVTAVEGLRVGGLEILWRRSLQALALPSDTATSSCALLVGAEAPDPVVPEGPVALLPFAGLLLLGVLALIRRRSRAAA